MGCPECERLSAERECLQRIFDLAVSNLKAADDLEKEPLLRLKAIADEAKVDLDRIDADIARHRGNHAANGSTV